MIEPVLALQRALAEHLSWHGARLNFLARFLLALLKVRSVNLAELATGFGGQAQVASSYKRLQRFFRVFEIDYEALARFLVHLFPVGEGPWYLTLDRTHWKFGQTEINFLILGIAHQGMALPLMWSVLDKAGNSDTAERIDLMQRFLKSFSQARIKARLADREFVGEEWFTWLQTQRLPFHIRLRRHTLIPHRRQVPVRADVLFDSLAPGPSRHLVGPRSVWGCVITISAWRLADGKFLIIASSGAPQSEAFTAYGHRWERETLFGALKSRGFNFEDTHLTHPERLSQWLALLAVAFAWTCPERSRRAYRTGEALAEQKAIPVKKRSSDPSSLSSATGSISSAPLCSTGLTARPISWAC